MVRYIQGQYVEDFFKDGTLRLSSFAACRGSRDSERGDWSEGRFEGMIGNIATAAFAHPAWVLCVSAVESHEMARKFGANAGIRIISPLKFAEAVARCVDGFQGGCLGPCTYRDGNFDQRAMPTPHFDERRPEESIAAIDRAVNRTASDSLFIKGLRYEGQAEWRFIWEFIGPQSDEYLPIRCPEALAHCKPVTFPL